MSNLIDIQTKIQELQKQASEIKSREFNATVREILAKMQAFDISIKDLQGAAGKPGKKRGRPVSSAKADSKTAKTRAKKKTAGTAVAAKYRGPNGETWSGRGLTPRWLSALISQGQAKESFAIQA